MEICHFPGLSQIHTNSKSHEVTLCLELCLALQLPMGVGRRTPKCEGRSRETLALLSRLVTVTVLHVLPASEKHAVGFSKPFTVQNSTALCSTALVNIPSLLPSWIPSTTTPSTHVLMFTLRRIFDSEWKVSSVIFLLCFITGKCSASFKLELHSLTMVFSGFC